MFDFWQALPTSNLRVGIFEIIYFAKPTTVLKAIENIYTLYIIKGRCKTDLLQKHDSLKILSSSGRVNKRKSTQDTILGLEYKYSSSDLVSGPL